MIGASTPPRTTMTVDRHHGAGQGPLRAPAGRGRPLPSGRAGARKILIKVRAGRVQQAAVDVRHGGSYPPPARACRPSGWKRRRCRRRSAKVSGAGGGRCGSLRLTARGGYAELLLVQTDDPNTRLPLIRHGFTTYTEPPPIPETSSRLANVVSRGG